ncbi:RNA-directed DNA polymerase, eukaryota, reverse transcriptase zinc-binding domain protein [Tanacetum coccineum]
MEIVNEFPTIAKSLCRDETSNKLDNDGFKMKTYATKVDNKLKLIPTGINNGREVVMFDDEILQEGIKKWQLTLCGHFVGYRMSYAELRWNTNVIMDKKEPKTLPLWVKLYSVPIEAWTVNGISAIASSLGKPLIIDKTTTRMRNEGRGRVGYARVLVEVYADKEFKDKIEICYKNSQNQIGGLSKFVEVEYLWKPPVCSILQVVEGHKDKLSVGRKSSERRDDSNGGKGQKGNNGKGNLEKMLGELERIKSRHGLRETSKENTSTSDGMLNRQNNSNKNKDRSVSPKASWKITEENMQELRKSAKKYSTLEDLGDTELNDEYMPTGKEVVDKYVRYQRKPTMDESKDRTSEMVNYFQGQWERQCQDGYMDEEDVCEMVDGMSKNILENVVNGKTGGHDDYP